jgi:RND family efflux transporter MFP subunit
MTQSDVNALLTQKRSADGSFKMIALQAGRVLHDKFITGEYVEAGHELMLISDESTMWVEARVTPDIASKIKVGNNAEILINKMRLPAKVIQLHHMLDETTRTSAVRIEVPNDSDLLHAGMFVSAVIATSNKSQSMQIPEAAVLRSSDGDWQVMVEQKYGGEFKAVEVDVIQISDGKAIIEGIKPGTRVVTQGAFFVQSELAKSGFDIHNH